MLAFIINTVSLKRERGVVSKMSKNNRATLRILNLKTWIIACFPLIILILFVQNIFCTETEFYCEQSDGSKFYYDKDKIVHTSGKVKIWNSVVLSDIGRAYVKKNVDTNGIDPYKIITYNEIDCKQKNFRVLSVIFCGKTNSFLRTIDDPKRLFIQNTCPEELFNIVCGNNVY
jgi:hypothetical protein